MTATSTTDQDGQKVHLYEVPEEQLRERRIELLPSTLAEALDAFEKDTLVQEC